MSGRKHIVGLTVVDHRRRQHRDAGVAMHVIVPLHKLADELVRMLKRSEAVREFVMVLQRTELRL